MDGDKASGGFEYAEMEGNMYFEKKNFIRIKDIINSNYTFYAHCKSNGAEKETLEEHVERCEKYFLKIIEDKGLEKIFQRIEKTYFGTLSEVGKKLFRSLAMNSIVFHDMGKINPIFQRSKMHHSILNNIKEFAGEGSKHSLTSAVLYLDYYIDQLKVKELPSEERKNIRVFLFLNSYVISRHHSDLDCCSKYLINLVDGCSAEEILEAFNRDFNGIYTKEITTTIKKIKQAEGWVEKEQERHTYEESVLLYTYARLMYSILVACDFYSTTEFQTGIEIMDLGELKEIDDFYKIYNNTDRIQKIRNNVEQGIEIDKLRTDLFLEAETELENHIDDDVFFLEAPTGSGKSNTALNLSFKLLEKNKDLNKILYVYPFNTLVEQNKNTLEKIFEGNKEILKKIVVINSVTPIDKEIKEKNNPDKELEYYTKALLNRQFLNYPFILTTHVSLFNIMFGNTKEAAFAFHQLTNSVIILDEIQSYKNSIWTEIITFIKVFSKLLNMKVIIMSATLPDLDVLTTMGQKVIRLIKNRDKYFLNPIFKDRVKVNYDLINIKTEEELLAHVKQNSFQKKKILIEFIKKERAYNFYNRLKQEDIPCKVSLLTGDDSSIERTKILNQIMGKEAQENGLILVATQVIEAGVDIDMDIGYKNIGRLDSEEQFMGRINRSFLKDGIVYFFNLDDMKKIYKGDARVDDQYSLLSKEMQKVLENKDFSSFYIPVLDSIIELNKENNEYNIEDFFHEQVAKLDFIAIAKRMELIEEDDWNMSVFFNLTIEDEEGNIMIGSTIWEAYKEMLMGSNNTKDMGYAKKQVLLSEITSKMNHFIYQIRRQKDLNYSYRIGELYYIENGEAFFENSKLNIKKLIAEGCMFCSI